LPGWPLLVPVADASVAASQPEEYATASTLAELRPAPAVAGAQAAAANAGPHLAVSETTAPADPLASPASPTQPLPWLALVWAFGAILTALPLLVALLSLWGLRRHSRAESAGPLVELLQEQSAQMGMRPSVRLFVGGRR